VPSLGSPDCAIHANRPVADAFGCARRMNVRINRRRFAPIASLSALLVEFQRDQRRTARTATDSVRSRERLLGMAIGFRGQLRGTGRSNYTRRTRRLKRVTRRCSPRPNRGVRAGAKPQVTRPHEFSAPTRSRLGVLLAPTTLGRASHTATDTPDFARLAAFVEPLCPHPPPRHRRFRRSWRPLFVGNRRTRTRDLLVSLSRTSVDPSRRGSPGHFGHNARRRTDHIIEHEGDAP